MQSAKTVFQQKFTSPIRLSPMVTNIHVLIESLGDETLSFKQLAEILSRYPVITARLLALANSAWAAPTQPITTVENACVRLGMSVVKSMSIAFAVASSFNVVNCSSFNNAYFWTNNLLVSSGAALLAAQLPQERGDYSKTAQTAGTLHGLGLLWLAEHLPIETSQALEHIKTDATVSLNEALLAGTGIDYCQVGAWIAQEWQLPEILVLAMQYHQDSEYRDEAWELALLVGSALKMATALGGDGLPPPVDETLVSLGVTAEQQQLVFQALAEKYDYTRALVKELFL